MTLKLRNREKIGVAEVVVVTLIEGIVSKSLMLKYKFAIDLRG